MAWKLQSSETNGLEIFAIRARHIRLRAASDDSSWQSSNTRQKRSCRYISHSVGSCEYSNRLRPDTPFCCRSQNSRKVVALQVNSPDDNGAVMGNWSDDFGGGTPPTKWLGSQKILQQYYKTKKPVKYGQCWVFSGVLATVCRTLGLPCRVVTNYASAHDTQSSLTVDYFVDAEGKIMEEMNSDSIWQVLRLSILR